MNLLIDQREQQDNPSVAEPAAQVTKKASTEDNIAQAEQKSYNYSRKDSHESDYGYTKKDGSQRPFLITILILVVSFAAFYLLYFRNEPKKTPVYDNSSENLALDGQQGDIKDDAALQSQENLPTDEVSSPKDNKGDEKLVRDTDITSTTYVSEQPDVGFSDPQGTAVGKTMGTVVQNLSTNVKLRTLYMDENAFTLEVSSTSSQHLDNFYQLLRTTLAPSAQIAALPNSLNIERTLLSGTINSEATDNQSTTGPGSTNQVRGQLSELASIANVNLVNTNFGTERLILNRKVVEVFVKVRGTASECHNFFAKFTAKKWNYKISKLLLMPEQGQDALVLRFIYFFPE